MAKTSLRIYLPFFSKQPHGCLGPHPGDLLGLGRNPAAAAAAAKLLQVKSKYTWKS